jgi:hypothetical protein
VHMFNLYVFMYINKCVYIHIVIYIYLYIHISNVQYVFLNIYTYIDKLNIDVLRCIVRDCLRGRRMG